jgi:hypothetical protein
VHNQGTYYSAYIEKLRLVIESHEIWRGDAESDGKTKSSESPGF